MLKSLGGLVSGTREASTPTGTQKTVTMADVVKQATSGNKPAPESEDGLVMETKLKIIEILQVTLLQHFDFACSVFGTVNIIYKPHFFT